MANELRAGQPLDAVFYKAITSDDDEQERFELAGQTFWCSYPTSRKATALYLNGMGNGKASTSIFSTNASKLEGIEPGDRVSLQGINYRVDNVDYDAKRSGYLMTLVQ